jgi:hypothetical protein
MTHARSCRHVFVGRDAIGEPLEFCCGDDGEIMLEFEHDVARGEQAFLTLDDLRELLKCAQTQAGVPDLVDQVLTEQSES